MKKVILAFLIGLAVVGCANDSDDNYGLDQDCFAYLEVEIVDEMGNDLYSEDYSGIIDRDNISESVRYAYKEQEHGVNVSFEPRPTKDMVDVFHKQCFHGLFLLQDELHFGDFNGWNDIDETFRIYWPDGTSNEIRFKSKGADPYYSMKVSVDGGKWENTPKVTFVK